MAHIILKFNWVSVPGEVNTGANLTRRGPLGIRATSLHPSARYSSPPPPLPSEDPVWISLPTRPLLFANITYFLAIEKNEKFFHSSFIKNSEWREYTIDFKLIKIEFLRNKFLRIEIFKIIITKLWKIWKRRGKRRRSINVKKEKVWAGWNFQGWRWRGWRNKFKHLQVIRHPDLSFDSTYSEGPRTRNLLRWITGGPGRETGRINPVVLR